MFSLKPMQVSAVSAPTTTIQGRLFNLQRCSVHDGPGIRTTVFFKGCPLSCDWCHNPEGIGATPELMLHAERCFSCGACSEVCPITEAGAAPAGSSWNAAACLRCGSCVEACPADARELAGRMHDVRELVDLVERDRPFFEASGGGVTFSGGEPLDQPDFLTACLRACRERGLHTAVDTCGLAPRDLMFEVADLADLVLYDLKHMDSEAHRRHTGVGNRQILDNLRLLSTTQTEIWVRVPLIPGVNDGVAHLEDLGAFLASLPRRHRVVLLPYHAIAAGKTTRLGVSAVFTAYPTPDTAMLGAVQQRLQNFGLEVATGGSP
jgi:pyruvate formate lyase activating enzyme